MTETPFTTDPQHTGLLVMDYQNGVLDSLTDSDTLLTIVAEAIAAVRRRGGTVGYVRIAFTDADYAAIPDTSWMAPLAVGRRLDDDSPATAVHDRLSPEPADIMVRKTRVGAFSTTDLDRLLRQREITTLLLAGIATSGVVLSTVRDAVDRDYRVVVLSDACADRDPATHDFLIEKIFPRQAHIATVAELPELLRPANPNGS